MTLYEFRKKTECISDKEAKKCELYMMLKENVFQVPRITDIHGDKQHIYIVSEHLDKYLKEIDFR